MEEKPPMQKQSFAYILGWSQEKIAGVACCAICMPASTPNQTSCIGAVPEHVVPLLPTALLRSCILHVKPCHMWQDVLAAHAAVYTCYCVHMRTHMRILMHEFMHMHILMHILVHALMRILMHRADVVNKTILHTAGLAIGPADSKVVGSKVVTSQARFCACTSFVCMLN